MTAHQLYEFIFGVSFYFLFTTSICLDVFVSQKKKKKKKKKKDVFVLPEVKFDHWRYHRQGGLIYVILNFILFCHLIHGENVLLIQPFSLFLNSKIVLCTKLYSSNLACYCRQSET